MYIDILRRAIAHFPGDVAILCERNARQEDNVSVVNYGGARADVTALAGQKTSEKLNLFILGDRKFFSLIAGALDKKGEGEGAMFLSSRLKTQDISLPSARNSRRLFALSKVLAFEFRSSRVFGIPPATSTAK